jgi:Rps23 Pro-64 3,4-dihydroxylase Tpa1-like proline 4-hydroxylase
MRELAVADLTRSWSKLLGELCSPVYSSALGSLAGVDLSGAGLEVTCWLYGPGDWLGSHTDKADKIVTQVFNLNAQWEGTWGGCLRILRSADTRDVHAEIAPKANSSVVLVRSDRSWHCVTPVRAEANSLRSRQVLTATFYREGSRGDDPGLGKHG